MPHPYFVREGNDVSLTFPITFAEAVQGGEVQVPTLDGSVRMTIPAGVSSGQRLKLSGKGIKSGSASGDQFVELQIKIPKKPDAKHIEAAKSLSESDFNPRSNLF